MTQVISTGTYCGPALLVSPIKNFGNYTNINTAIAASSPGNPIVVAPGTYNNNITLLDEVNIVGYSQAINDVIIDAPMVTNDVLTRLEIRGVSFVSNTSSPIISVAGTTPKVINFYNCAFEAISGPVISLTTSGMIPSEINFYNCEFSIIGNSNSIFLYNVSGTNFLNFYTCHIFNQGGSSTVSNNSDGLVAFYDSTIECLLSTTGSGFIAAFNSVFNSYIGVACNLNSNLTSTFFNCDFNSGSFPSVTVSASATATLSRCGTTSTNPNSFSGAGTIEYNLISNNSSSSPVVPTSSTVTNLAVALGDVSVNSLTLNTPPANGTLLIGNGSEFSANTLTAGSNITIDNTNPGNITISASSGISYVEQNANFTASSNTGYFCVGPLTATMTASPSNGDVVTFLVLSFNNVTIQPNTGQFMRIGSAGINSCTNTFYGSTISFIYRAASLTWIAQSFIGNWTTS